jgi:hypothetical protein
MVKSKSQAAAGDLAYRVVCVPSVAPKQLVVAVGRHADSMVLRADLNVARVGLAGHDTLAALRRIFEGVAEQN